MFSPRDTLAVVVFIAAAVYTSLNNAVQVPKLVMKERFTNAITSLYQIAQQLLIALLFLALPLLPLQALAQDYVELNDIAVDYYTKGQTDSALIYLNQAFAIVDQSDTLNYEQIKDNLLFLNEELGNYEQAAALYSDWDALHDKVLELYRNGQYTGGLEYASRALDLCEQAYGKAHENYGFNLNSLALLLEYTGRYMDAIEVSEAALAHAYNFYGEMHRYYAVRIGNLAVLLAKTGQYNKALPKYLKARDITEALVGKEHPDYALILNNLASLYESMGRYQDALEVFIEAAEITKATLGEEHEDYGYRLHNLAYMYRVMGRYEEAVPLYLQALENRKLNLGEGHPLYGAGLSELASTYQRMGKYEDALLLHQKALKNAEDVYGKWHDQYGVRLSNLADFYELLGKYDEALELYHQAKQVSEHVFGKNHPTYAKDLNNVASLLEALGHFDQAIAYYQESLDITAVALGEDHEEYSVGLNNLGNAYLQLGRYKEAEPLLMEALERKAASVGENHPSYAIPLNNLAMLHQYQGNYQQALHYHLKALQVSESTLGKDHEQAGVRLNNLASVHLQMKNYSLAQQVFMAANENLKQQIEKVFAFTNEADKAKFFKSLQDYFQIYQSVSLESDTVYPQFQSMLYNNQLLLKGLLLNSSRDVLEVIRQSGDSAVISQYKLWVDIKRRLAAQYSLPIALRSPNIDSLEALSADLESSIVRSSKPFRLQREQGRVKWEDVLTTLQSGEIAVEFARFKHYSARWTDSIYYVAYLIKPGAVNPELVYLFEEEQLNLLLQNASPTTLYKPRALAYEEPTVSEKLYHLIFGPLLPYLAGTETIYFSPDGKLHQIALAALSDSTGKLLSEDYHLVQMSSTGNVAHKKEEPRKSPAVFAGGIQYDFVPQEQPFELASTDPLVELRGKGTLSRGSSWSYLPGTKMEAKALYSLYQKAEARAEIISDTTASEHFLKSLSGSSPSVLHLATHGFFFEAEESVGKGGKAVYSTADDPLLRAGLVMAGGNYTWKNGTNPFAEEDGILTAYEISNLDLSNTDLVVLSACETGLGDIEGSEGVYGLQRAFRMAGVDYLIMSLWEVPDEETAQFMYTFYDLWLSGTNIREAFNQTQHLMSQRYRYDPEKWAAFVLVE